MEKNPLAKKYQVIDERLVLFNEEYYLSVDRLDVSGLSTVEREALFNHLYSFESSEMELEIDVSEEAEGTWYFQLLVPHVLTLPEAAKRRIDKGTELLAAHLDGKPSPASRTQLLGEEIYEYVKRYNPDLERIA